jgi:hypothetical protein
VVSLVEELPGSLQPFLSLNRCGHSEHAFGDDFKAGFPGGHGNARNLLEIAGEIATRMIRIFTRNEIGHRLRRELLDLPGVSTLERLHPVL